MCYCLCFTARKRSKHQTKCIQIPFLSYQNQYIVSIKNSLIFPSKSDRFRPEILLQSWQISAILAVQYANAVLIPVPICGKQQALPALSLAQIIYPMIIMGMKQEADYARISNTKA